MKIFVTSKLINYLSALFLTIAFSLSISTILYANSAVGTCSRSPNLHGGGKGRFIPGYGFSMDEEKSLRILSSILGNIKISVENTLTDSERDLVKDIKYCIDTWNTERYGFYYRVNKRNSSKEIVFGYQSLSILSKIASAIAISETLDVKAPYRWWRSYALYLRRTTDWSEAVEPLYVFNKEEFSYIHQISEGSEDYFLEMLTFIVSHEISHALLEHEFDRNLEELSISERKSLLRNWEEEADSRAVELLSRKLAFENGLTLSGASLIFINFHLIDGWRKNQNSTHPADTKRIQSFSKFVLNDLDHTFWPSNEWDIMRSKAESLGKNAIKAEEPGYFDAFDREASLINLETLEYKIFK